MESKSDTLQGRGGKKPTPSKSKGKPGGDDKLKTKKSPVIKATPAGSKKQAGKKQDPKAKGGKDAKPGKVKQQQQQQLQVTIQEPEPIVPQRRNTEARRGSFYYERLKKFKLLNALNKLMKQMKKSTDKLEAAEDTIKAHKAAKSTLRYKRPIERLLKKIKKERLEDTPHDVNIHRHSVKRHSWGGNAGVRKQVGFIHETLEKHKRPLQPKVGWDYNKRQKRLLMGRRHRPLETGWRYFEFMKNILPRRIRPNSHVPDGIFFFFSIALCLSVAIPSGFMYGVEGFLHVMEDAKEFEMHKSGIEMEDIDGAAHWEEHAPFEKVAWRFIRTTDILTVTSILGFIGVYVADQTLHLIYVIGSLLYFAIQFANTRTLPSKNYCHTLKEHASPLIVLLIDNYYETVNAFDINNKPVKWKNPETGQMEVVKLRSYRAANVLDRMQKSWQCCGDVGFDDYDSKGIELPPSCCSPLWNLNPLCASAAGFEPNSPKLMPPISPSAPNGSKEGCSIVLERFCENIEDILGTQSETLLLVQFIIFLLGCIGLLLQARQIRQLKRTPHLRISAGTISQSLQTSAGTDAAVKTGGGGVQAVADASKITEKQTDHIKQMRIEAAKYQQEYEDESTSTTDSSDEAPVHTVDFEEMQNLQKFVDKEDQPEADKMDVEKTVEGFAGRFNIVANKNLQPYVSGIFSTTFQNETNAGLEAINQILERQFAQHTTDYNWRKLLTKPKKGKDDIVVNVGKKGADKQEPSKGES